MWRMAGNRKHKPPGGGGSWEWTSPPDPRSAQAVAANEASQPHAAGELVGGEEVLQVPEKDVPEGGCCGSQADGEEHMFFYREGVHSSKSQSLTFFSFGEPVSHPPPPRVATLEFREN